MFQNLKTVFCVVLMAAVCSIANAQSTLAPKLNTQTMQFSGSKYEQALYMLRFVKKYGELGEPLQTLPPFLDSMFTRKISLLNKAAFKKYLQANGIQNDEIGGSIDSSLCDAFGNTASYLVIHDASNFLSNTTSFSDTLNTSALWSGNNIEKMRTFKNAHMFVNRLGQSITCNDFSQKVQGVKFENPLRNPDVNRDVHGVFLHIEMIQPRIPDPGKKNDAIAIMPGFTGGQYKRLALIYMAASARKGDWMVPTFHAVVDNGIKDAHDDPQNFELLRFDRELSLLYHQLFK